MKLLAAILSMTGVAIGIVPQCAGAVQTEHNLDDLLDAIATVESGNDPNAYNEKENAVGMYQIRPIYLKDVNLILGYQKYKLADRYDPWKSREMVFVYLRHYGSHKSLDDMSRIHNGGPRGYKKQSTLPYLRKIKKVLEQK